MANEAVRDTTHVLHLATSKETPESVMDVAVKGIFWLLEACRISPTFQQFVLIGGDNSVGHFVYPHPIPVTETQKHTSYAGCYALSKVLDEVILEQYYIQYGLAGCCLRAPWIMEKDDFRYQLSFGEDVFGGPRWRDLVGAEKADEYFRSKAVPVMLDPQGLPVKRNFVHVEDLIAAILGASIIPKHINKLSTSAWMSRWIMANLPRIWQSRAVCLRCRCPPSIIRTGWTMRRPSFCWAGGQYTIWRK
jgi:UDP-glucose 4-epimerase